MCACHMSCDNSPPAETQSKVTATTPQTRSKSGYPLPSEGEDLCAPAQRGEGDLKSILFHQSGVTPIVIPAFTRHPRERGDPDERQSNRFPFALWGTKRIELRGADDASASSEPLRNPCAKK